MQKAQCNIRVAPAHRTTVLEIGRRLRDDPEFFEELRTWLDREDDTSVRAMIRRQLDTGVPHDISENSPEDGDIGCVEVHISRNRSLKIMNGSTIGVVFGGINYLAKVKNSRIYFRKRYYNLRQFIRYTTGYGGNYLDMLWVKLPTVAEWTIASNLLVEITSSGPIPQPQKTLPESLPFKGNYEW
jgi:hypothetical protein